MLTKAVCKIDPVIVIDEILAPIVVGVGIGLGAGTIVGLLLVCAIAVLR